MEATSKPESHTCSVCSKQAALVCKACKGFPDIAGSAAAAYYCGSNCQRAGWSAHKVSCKAAPERRALFRGGEIARRLFYTFNRNSFMWAIEKAEKVGSTWFVHDGKISGKSIVAPFPTAVFPASRDQRAILSYNSCNGAIGHMHKLLEDFLQDICSGIEELIVKVKNVPLKIVRVASQMVDFRNYDHNVLRVTLKGGGTYALDMTGPQFGWYDSAVMPWSDFINDKVDVVKEVRRFGETSSVVRAEAHAAGVPRKVIQQIRESVEDAFSNFLELWQRSNNLPLKFMLRLPEDEFATKQESLLKYMDEQMVKFMAFGQENGCFDIFK